MTPESDQIGKLIRKASRGPLRFAGSDEEVESRQPMQIAVVEGRNIKVKTEIGQKKIKGRARAVIAPETGLQFISGGDGAQISVDDLSRLLNKDQIIKVESALYRDRKRRKEKLRGK